jgi:hypothetical protein
MKREFFNARGERHEEYGSNWMLNIVVALAVLLYGGALIGFLHWYLFN